MKRTKIISVVVSAFLLIIGFVHLISSITYSNGERTGVISKVSNKGLFFKTWEGELSMGNFDQGGIPTLWQFSVADKDVVKEITETQRSGSRVTLVYEEKIIVYPWQGSTHYFVTEVQKTNMK